MQGDIICTSIANYNKPRAFLLAPVPIHLPEAKGFNESHTPAIVAYSNLSRSVEEYGDQIPNPYLLKTECVE